MTLHISFFDLLIIIGMATGIICSVLLLRKSSKKPANTFLAFGMLGFVWLNTKTLLHSFNLWEIHGIGFFPNSVEILLPPLFYFYLRSMIDAKFKFGKREWVHFIPFIIGQVYSIIVYAFVMQTSIYAEKEIIGLGLHFNAVKNIEEYISLISIAIYLSAAYRQSKKYTDWLTTHTSDTQLSELRFLKNLVIGFLILFFYVITNLILNQFLDPTYHDSRWHISHLIIATLVYYMGLVGYKNSDVIPQDFSTNKIKEAKKLVNPVDISIIQRLTDLLENDKIYLNPKLSLQELAQLLNLNEVTLSNTINTHYQKNFRGFINDLRVEEVKRRLKTEGLGNLSLFGLAKECGFNSEASFYRIFRSTTGLTPKQFLAAQS